ncbi:MAG: ABC transporter ATP-binding protein [Bacteroidota bacterium]
MIVINDLTKKYAKKTVIEKLNLTIENGQIYCLLGKNGAGKTTLINLILDLLIVDEGTIQLFGKAHNQLDKETKKRIGVVNENLSLLEEISGEEYLYFVGKIYQIPTEILKKRINDLFNYFFEDDSDLKKNIAKYSTGMKKKIAFCASVIHTPDILILDEPFSGLDPLVANQMIHFIIKYQRTDRIIFISSHDLSYVEKVSTHIGVLDNHRLVFNSTINSFTENGAKELDAALLRIIKPNESIIEKIDWL